MLPQNLVGGDEVFILSVQGESMIEAGILDGDFVIVRRQSHAENGDIVVAMIDDEATVKRIFYEKTRVRASAGKLRHAADLCARRHGAGARDRAVPADVRNKSRKA